MAKRRDPIAELYALIAKEADKLATPSNPSNPVIRSAESISNSANHMISPVLQKTAGHIEFPLDPKRHNRFLTTIYARDLSKTITLQCVEAPGHGGGCHYENPSNQKRK
jgi:hypothetical protein